MRYDSWAAEAIERVSDPQNLEVIRRYIRWHHQRRMNLMDEVSRGTFLRAKQEVTVAIGLLNWLTGHGIKLPELQQSHLDSWQAGGPTTRRIAERFLKWAIKTKAAPAGLTIVPHRRGTSPRLGKPRQDEALKRVIDAGGLEASDRAAAIFILVYGQQAENIARLTWNDVTITEDLVTIRLGTIHIAVPDPLAET
jgi:integrase